MSFLSRPATWLSLLFTLMMQMPAQAAMVQTPEMLLQSERAELISLLEQEQVQQQLMELGVDQKAARERVGQMTHEEIAALNGKINELPAGAGISTLDLVLIILLLVLLL
ncbi:MAG: PA2779 family protein [Gammaproteobacteria bacterium]|nr:PA2779 family protein [Gammaproteobacteria bacterium]